MVHIACDAMGSAFSVVACKPLARRFLLACRWAARAAVQGQAGAVLIPAGLGGTSRVLAWSIATKQDVSWV